MRPIIIILAIFTTNQALAFDPFLLHEAFRREISLKLPKAAKNTKEVVYGNPTYGYFSTDEFRIEGDALKLTFLPPGYQLPIEFKANVGSENEPQYVNLGTKKIDTPLPKSFQALRFEVQHGRFSPNFFLASGSLPLSRLKKPDNAKRTPDFPLKNKTRFTFAMVINRLGEIVYGYLPQINQKHFDAYVYAAPIKTGVYGLIMGKKDGIFSVFDGSGKVLQTINAKEAKNPYPLHHDFAVGADGKIYTIGNRLVHIKEKYKMFGDEDSYLSNTLLRMDLKTGEAEVALDFLDFFTPLSVEYWQENLEKDRFVTWGEKQAEHDFFHTNTIRYYPDKGYLVSFKHLDTLVLFDKALRKVLWTVGPTRKDTFRTQEGSRFSHQHSPEVLPNGNIVVFDNGFLTKKSRIIEVKLNAKQKTAELVWEYSPKPSLYSKNRGAVVQYEDRVIGFFVDPDTKLRSPLKDARYDYLVEVEPGTGKEMARMRLEFFTASPGYRAEPLVTIGKEKFRGHKISLARAETRKDASVR